MWSTVCTGRIQPLHNTEAAFCPVVLLLPLWPSIAPKIKKRKTHFDTKHTVHIVVTCPKRHKERKGDFFTHKQKQQVFNEDNKCN